MSEDAVKLIVVVTIAVFLLATYFGRKIPGDNLSLFLTFIAIALQTLAVILALNVAWVQYKRSIQSEQEKTTMRLLREVQTALDSVGTKFLTSPSFYLSGSINLQRITSLNLLVVRGLASPTQIAEHESMFREGLRIHNFFTEAMVYAQRGLIDKDLYIYRMDYAILIYYFTIVRMLRPALENSTGANEVLAFVREAQASYRLKPTRTLELLRPIT